MVLISYWSVVSSLFLGCRLAVLYLLCMQVETIFRQEKIVALYELLDQFCHLVINRLESIKSQKYGFTIFLNETWCMHMICGCMVVDEQMCRCKTLILLSIIFDRECPSDLKEAVASLIFAAPKCAELEELKRVTKQLMSKYGTDFSVAVKELRPDCGVNKQVCYYLHAYIQFFVLWVFINFNGFLVMHSDI